MISDFVKGRKKFDYASGIQQGIALHRTIDRFTDEHPVVQKAKQYFRPVYRLYSGAMVDVVFDHFLAIEPTEFSEDSLLVFSEEVYTKLNQHEPVFPEKFRYMFPYMKQHNWLFNYRTKRGIETSLGAVVRRATYLSDSQPACEIFEQEYQPLQELFRQFWPALRSFAFDEWKAMKDKKN